MLKKLEAIETVRLGPGTIVGLTPDQARTRLHNLTPLKERGVFNTTGPIEFKRGEQFGYEGAISRAMQEVVVGEGLPAPAAKRSPKPKAGPKAEKAD